MILAFGFYQRAKKGQKQISEFVRIKVTITFTWKCLSNCYNLCHTVVLSWSLETQSRKQSNFQNALSKSSPPMCTSLVREVSNCYDHFLRFSGFYLTKYFWSVLNSSNLILQWFFNKKNLTLSLPLTRWAGHNTNLSSNTNISKPVRVNIVFARNVFQRVFNKLPNDV